MSEVVQKRDGFGIGELGQVPESTPLDDLEAERLQPSRPRRGRARLCDCGHWSEHPMMASLGTVCPNCYDKEEWSG